MRAMTRGLCEPDPIPTAPLRCFSLDLSSPQLYIRDLELKTLTSLQFHARKIALLFKDPLPPAGWGMVWDGTSGGSGKAV